MFLPNNKPKNTAINPRILLASIFKKASLYSPVFNNIIVSRAKEEKVVKPPNKPVNKNIRK